MKPVVTLLLAVLFITSCSDTDKEFKEHSSGLLYQFLDMNPEGETPEVGDILVLDLSIQNKDKQVIDANEFYRIQLANPVYQGDFNTGLSILQVGDSICFKLDAGSFYEKNRKRDLPDAFELGDYVYIYLRLRSLLSAKDLEEERLRIYHTDEDQEIILLKDYLDRTDSK